MRPRAAIGALLVACACGCGNDPGQGEGGLAVSPEVVEFGEVVVGLAGRRTLVLENRGRDLIRIREAKISDGLRPDLRLDRVPAALPGGSNAEVDVVFAPSSPGTRSGRIELITGDAEEEPTVTVSGTAVAPSLTASPTALDFGRVVVGEARTATVTVRNDGSAPVVIDAITPDLETSEEFEVGRYNIRTLDPGEAFGFTVTFRPAFPGRAVGRIVVGDDGSRPEPLAVEVVGEGADGELDLEPRQLDFTGVLVGESRTRFFDVRNTGTTTHTVDAVEIQDPDSAYAVITSTAARAPFSLAPGEERRIQVRYAPTQSGLDVNAVLVVSDALRSGASVALFGDPPAVPQAHLEVRPAAVDFGGVEIGTSSPRPIELESGPSEVPLPSTPRIEPADAPFSVSGALPAGVGLAAYDTHRFEVRFSPLTEGPAQARLLIPSGDVEQPVRQIPLLGRGETSPSADVDVRPLRLEAGLVPRGLDVLRHIEVFNRGGAPLRIVGVTLTEDAGGRFRLPPIASDVTVGPSEVLALGLEYRDPLGIAGAHTGTVAISTDDPDHSIVHVPLFGATGPPWTDDDADIVVRLSWNTQGTDLDLHLLRPGAVLFDQPGDCCWCNPNPRWSDPVDERPLLDRNDRSDLGPEVIRLFRAKSGSYGVVVHYRGPDPTGPPAVAEVEITIFGRPGLLRTRTLGPGQRWSVGRIEFMETQRQGNFSADTLPLERPLVKRCF